jgi:hypothetical protein
MSKGPVSERAASVASAPNPSGLHIWPHSAGTPLHPNALAATVIKVNSGHPYTGLQAMIDFNNKGFFKLKQNAEYAEYAERVTALLC